MRNTTENFTTEKAQNIGKYTVREFVKKEFGTIRTIEIDNEIYFVGKDIADKLGYQNGSRDINRHVDEDDRTDVTIHDGSQNRNMTVINESGLYALIFGSKLESAKRFKKWVTSEVLPSIRKTGTYTIQSKGNTEQGIAVVKFIADDLNVNSASRLLMYENYCIDVGIPTGFLPKYEHNGNRELKSATVLLKENNCQVSVKNFNILLLENGYLEERERASGKGGVKKFKALTDKGLNYGENAISPKNQREVQPLYYADTFMELFKDVQNY